MRRIVFTMLTLIIVSGCAGKNPQTYAKATKSSSSEAAEKGVDGFRGMKWGESLTELKKNKNFSYTGNDAGADIYSIKGDSLKIGNADIKSISYLFANGKFCGASVKTVGLANFERMKETVFVKYGSGAKPNRFMESYFWFDDKKTRMMLEYKEVAGNGLLFMYSKETYDQEKLAEAEKAKKGAAKDL